VIDFGFDRFWKLTTAAGRLGWALLGDPTEQRRLKSAARAIESLSKLKGAPMKLGQMLSLHEGLLPPEISGLLAGLRKDAEPIAVSEIQDILRLELGEEKASQLRLEEKPIAAASLGQVHRASHPDGRVFAIKVQYPGIREALGSDLRILRTIMTAFSPMTAVPARKLIGEVKDRLLEEIDYVREASHLDQATEMYSDPIVIPTPVREFCTGRVLTTNFIPSMSIAEASVSAETLRFQWAVHLLTAIVKGAVEHKFLHADPNAANVGFLSDGRIVLYDFGCVKLVPESLSDSYSKAAAELLSGRLSPVPGLLFAAGIRYKSGEKLTEEFIQPIARMLNQVFPDEETVFGSIPDIYSKLWQMGTSDFLESRNIVFPPDLIFVHRTLLGHFGNLRALKPRGNWRQIVLGLLADAGVRPD